MADLKAIEAALRAADAAGNVEDARRLAQAYADARNAQPDFSNVRGGVRTSEQVNRPDFSDARGASRSTESATPRESLFRMDSDFREHTGVGIGDMLWGAAKDMFGSRQGAAEYLVEQINKKHGLSSQINGGARVVQDANGDPMIRLPDGATYRMNDAGFDNADAANVAGNVAAAWMPASWAARAGQARNLGVLGRAALQGATAATTEAGLQAATDGGHVDPVRVALAGAGGVGGEALGTGLAVAANRGNAAVRNLLGRNAEEAAALLAKQGIEPTPELVAKVAPKIEQLRAGANPQAITGEGMFGFDYSLGQRMTDPTRQFAQLSREEMLRQTPGGHAAFDAMQRNNAAKLDDALVGMGERFGGNPTRTPAELVQGAGAALGRQADELGRRITSAYESAGKGARTAVDAQAIAALPARLRQSVREFDIHPNTTPATARTLDLIQHATTATLGGNVKGVTLRAIETQRRILNNSIGSAANPADRAAMLAVKREFDGWLDDAVERALVTGDPASLSALKDARSLRAEYGRRFEGGKDADRFIQGLLDGTRTPEELLNIALGASQVSKAGGARFVERLRLAANNDPEVMGGLRAAHFARLTRGTDGKPLQLGQIVRNVRQTGYANGSVLRALYSPQQWAEVRQLADALEPMIAKGDFARSSGTTERMARMMLTKLGGGFVGDTFNAVTSGLKGVQAQRAIRGPVRAKVASPPLIPTLTGPLSAESSR